MKALPASTRVYERVPHACLYRDDLEQLLATWRAAGLTVGISDRTLSFDSLEEVRNHHGTHLKRLALTGLDASGNEAIKLELGLWGWELSADAVSMGRLSHEAGSLVRSRQTALHSTPAWMLISFGLIGMLLSLIPGIPHSVFVALTSWGLALILFSIGADAYRERHQQANLRFSHAASFFSRNADEVKLSALSTLVGGVLGWLLGRFGP